MVALKWSMQNLYGVEPGEVFWAASDVGWVVGHSYIVYAPLLHGCTTILYEGKPVGTPDAGAFWRVISEHQCVGAVHRADRLPRDQEGGPAGQAARPIRPVEIPHAVPRRRARRSRHARLGGESAEGAGDRSLVADRDRLGIAGNPVGLGHAAGEARLADRADARLRRARRRRGRPRRSQPNTMGSIVIKLPLPPGCLPTLWQNDERFKDSYLTEFPGYYKTADAGFMDEDGYLFVMGRTDDIINVAGHRLSTGGMEEVLASHPGRRRMRRDRHQGRAQGRGAVRLHRAQGRRQPPAGGDREGDRRRWCARRSARSRAFKLAITVRAPAEDALRQDPARHHQEDRRRRGLDDAGDHRRPGDPGRDRRGAEGGGVWGDRRASVFCFATTPVILFSEIGRRAFPLPLWERVPERRR